MFIPKRKFLTWRATKPSAIGCHIVLTTRHRARQLLAQEPFIRRYFP